MPALAVTILQLVQMGISMTPEIVSGIQSIAALMSSNQPPTLAQWQAMDAALLSLNAQIQQQKEGSMPTVTAASASATA